MELLPQVVKGTMTETSNDHRRTLDAPFIEKTYGEAMGLVHQAAAYLEGDGALYREELGDALRPIYTAESLRVTTRLMQVVSWLMTQRAVLTGEMSAMEAREYKIAWVRAGSAWPSRLRARKFCPTIFRIWRTRAAVFMNGSPGLRSIFLKTRVIIRFTNCSTASTAAEARAYLQ